CPTLDFGTMPNKANFLGYKSLVDCDLRRTRAELRRKTKPILGRWLGIVASGEAIVGSGRERWSVVSESEGCLVRGGPPDPAVRPTVGFRVTRSRSGTSVEVDGRVRDPARTEWRVGCQKVAGPFRSRPGIVAGGEWGARK